jgi:hypothetical protein
MPGKRLKVKFTLNMKTGLKCGRPDEYKEDESLAGCLTFFKNNTTNL